MKYLLRVEKELKSLKESGNYIPRPKYRGQIEQCLNKGHIAILYGLRRVGKSSLIVDYLLETFDCDQIIDFSGDDVASIVQGLQNYSVQDWHNEIGNNQVIVFDEAHKIPGIDQILKRIYESNAELKILVSGSSSFMLSNSIKESLAGRKQEIEVLPLAQYELMQHERKDEIEANLSQRLVYGSMPAVVNLQDQQDRIDYLLDYINDQLKRDLLIIDEIRKPKIIDMLIELLARQVGQPVNINELSTQLGQYGSADNATVVKYLESLKQNYIIFELSAYTTNLRKEITKSKKYYFYDLGIRNAVINDFRPVAARGKEAGFLWENYIVLERLKRNLALRSNVQSYFWREKNKAEIDLIEIANSELQAFEIKLKSEQLVAPKAWQTAYPEHAHSFTTINKTNYLNFIGIEA